MDTCRNINVFAAAQRAPLHIRPGKEARRLVLKPGPPLFRHPRPGRQPDSQATCTNRATVTTTAATERSRFFLKAERIALRPPEIRKERGHEDRDGQRNHLAAEHQAALIEQKAQNSRHLSPNSHFAPVSLAKPVATVTFAVLIEKNWRPKPPIFLFNHENK